MARPRPPQMIRVLAIPPGERPLLHEVEAGSWRTWYHLVHQTTDTFQQLPLTQHLVLLFDEEGAMKEFPLNFLLPGLAPQPTFDPSFIVDLTKGRGMMPRAPGIGHHEILGTVLVARVRGSDYTDLTEEDIETVTEAFGSRPPR